MRLRDSIGPIVVASAILFAIVAPHAQQPAAQGGGGRGQAPAGQVPAAGRGAPTAPPAVQWSTPPAPAVTMALDTGVQHMVWVVPTRGLIQPWSMAFLPDGAILITERPGCLRIVRG